MVRNELETCTKESDIRWVYLLRQIVYYTINYYVKLKKKNINIIYLIKTKTKTTIDLR